MTYLVESRKGRYSFRHTMTSLALMVDMVSMLTKRGHTGFTVLEKKG